MLFLLWLTVRLLSLWVPKTLSASCDLGILMEQPTESIPPHDPCAGRWSRRCGGSQRWHLAERAVRPVLVIVHDIVRQHRLRMSPPHGQHPVQQLTTNGADPSFGECVHARCPHRRA
jgi:hypothetical protein